MTARLVDFNSSLADVLSEFEVPRPAGGGGSARLLERWYKKALVIKKSEEQHRAQRRIHKRWRLWPKPSEFLTHDS